MKISPALNGFIKGLVIVVLTAVAAFMADSANLAPLLGNTLALIVAGVASSVESSIRDRSDKGLFGAVTVR